MTDLILPMPMILAVMLDKAEQRQLQEGKKILQARSPLKAGQDRSGCAPDSNPILHSSALPHGELSTGELAYARKVSED